MSEVSLYSLAFVKWSQLSMVTTVGWNDLTIHTLIWLVCLSTEFWIIFLRTINFKKPVQAKKQDSLWAFASARSYF